MREIFLQIILTYASVKKTCTAISYLFHLSKQPFPTVVYATQRIRNCIQHWLLFLVDWFYSFLAWTYRVFLVFLNARQPMQRLHIAARDLKSFQRSASVLLAAQCCKGRWQNTDNSFFPEHPLYMYKFLFCILSTFSYRRATINVVTDLRKN